jgi:biopolymer transport protein ExbD
MSAPPKQIVINIRRDGTTVVAGKTYTHEELAKLLETEVKPDPSRAVLIRADQESMMKYFAGVASLCKLTGINEVKIGFLQQEASAK